MEKIKSITNTTQPEETDNRTWKAPVQSFTVVLNSDAYPPDVEAAIRMIKGVESIASGDLAAAKLRVRDVVIKTLKEMVVEQPDREGN